MDLSNNDNILFVLAIARENLHKVDEKLYRSAQPTAEGMTNLVALGVKTVVGARPLPARCGPHGHDIRKAAKELKTSKWQRPMGIIAMALPTICPSGLTSSGRLSRHDC